MTIKDQLSIWNNSLIRKVHLPTGSSKRPHVQTSSESHPLVNSPSKKEFPIESYQKSKRCYLLLGTHTTGSHVDFGMQIIVGDGKSNQREQLRYERMKD